MGSRIKKYRSKVWDGDTKEVRSTLRFGRRWKKIKFFWNGRDWYINHTLAYQLMSLCWNIKNDWDVVILVTGDRMVRVGKSVLAMTVCAFLAYTLKKMKRNDDAYNLDTIFFDNKMMMDTAPKLPKYSVCHYDEGREGLAANKAMQQFQKDLIDFFTECGQLNHFFVVVAPDFFDLKEFIAVGRSEVLINVYRKEVKKEIDIFRDGNKWPVVVFDRGHFEFFGRKTKSWLYDKYRSTSKKNYGLVKANFIGDFTNQYPLDEAKYKQLKEDSLSRFKKRHEEQKEEDKQVYVKHFIRYCKEKGMTGTETAKELAEKLGKQLTSQRINQISKEMQVTERKRENLPLIPTKTVDNVASMG